MCKSYKRRFQKFSEILSDPELINYARQFGSNAFSRKRKMPLQDMLLWCLSKKGFTTTFEFSKAVDFQTAYLAGYLADKYDIDAEQSAERTNEVLERAQRRSLRQQ